MLAGLGFRVPGIHKAGATTTEVATRRLDRTGSSRADLKFFLGSAFFRVQGSGFRVWGIGFRI